MCLAQVKQFDLTKGGAQLYHKNIYCYGLFNHKTNATLYVYELDNALQKKDSFYVDLGKTKVDEYLQVYADTLHDYLNIYVQLKENKSVRVFRFNHQLELIAKIEGIEIARLNSSAMFKNNPLYFKNKVYSIHVESDSLGKQFYINKYVLHSETKNFEYTFEWQFPFERKNIFNAHIFYANDNFVLVYVIRTDELKTGQWILKLNTSNGKLIKATKLNDNEELSTYLFGDFNFDAPQKSLLLIGQKFSEKELHLKTNTLNISTLTFATVYSIKIDSLGEIKHKQDFKIPINNVVSGAKKQANAFLLKIKNSRTSAIGKINFETDVYKATHPSFCFLYTTTIPFTIDMNEEQWVLQKNSIAPNLLIDAYYASNDKLDRNGKLCLDEANRLDQLSYTTPHFPIKLGFKVDEDKNQHWLLSKSNLKKNTINYSVLSPVKKIYQVSSTDDILKTNAPGFILLSNTRYVLFSQIEETKFQLKLYNW